jgi:hypothetical protein
MNQMSSDGRGKLNGRIMTTSAGQVVKSESDSPSPKIEARQVNRSDALGYAYLCLKKHESQVERTRFTSSEDIGARMKQIAQELGGSESPEGQLIDGAKLSATLEKAGISSELWNSVLAKQKSGTEGRDSLNVANQRGQALALGLPESASRQLIFAETKLQEDKFSEVERQRIYDCMRTERRDEWRNPTQHVLLQTIRTKPIYDIPADGFTEYKVSPLWLVKAAGMKLWANVVIKNLDRVLGTESSSVARAATMTWLEPVAQSVQSPSIQSLLKTVSDDHIDTEIRAIPDNKGFLLEISFYVSKDKLGELQHQIHRQSWDRQGRSHDIPEG